jgi:hypothetical protein
MKRSAAKRSVGSANGSDQSTILANLEFLILNFEL